MGCKVSNFSGGVPRFVETKTVTGTISANQTLDIYTATANTLLKFRYTSLTYNCFLIFNGDTSDQSIMVIGSSQFPNQFDLQDYSRRLVSPVLFPRAAGSYEHDRPKELVFLLGAGEKLQLYCTSGNFPVNVILEIYQ